VSNGFELRNGVLVHEASITPRHLGFEAAYQRIRSKENRVLAVEEVRRLPFIRPSHPDFRQWKMRATSSLRLRKHLRKKRRTLKVLEVGCGNGFLSNMLAAEGHEVTAADISLSELQTAASAFGSTQVRWCYVDVQNAAPPGAPFDAILFAASLQYFGDLNAIIKRCADMLVPGGEIHILDTPFYDGSEKNLARNRSLQHFQKLGAPELAHHYFHHTLEEILTHGPRQMPQPWRLFYRLVGRDVSPFPWFIIKF
jgi:2-polyprenyl-3-methyl-5-hydroxy-6-metoxy-1,4-benzoquinol methylase